MAILSTRCVSRADAARTLGVSVRLFDRLVAERRIRVVRVGRRRVFDIRDLEQVIDAWKTPPAVES